MSKKAKDSASSKTWRTGAIIILLLALLGRGMGESVARKHRSKQADEASNTQATATFNEPGPEKRTHAMLGPDIFHGDDINDLLARGLVRLDPKSRNYSPVNLSFCGYKFQHAEIELEGNKAEKINYSIFVKPEQLIEEASLLIRVFCRQYGEMTWRTPDEDNRPNRFFRWDDPYNCVMMGIFPESSLLSVTVYPQK